MPEKSQRNSARVFGVTYPVIFAILMWAFLRYYAPLLSWENAAETARHFPAHERAVRIYIAAALLYGLGLLIWPTALYVILRPVSRGLALFAAFCRLAYAFLWLVMLLDLFGALRMMGSANPLQGLGPDGLSALAGLQMASGRDAYYAGLGFYGLGSITFSYLWLRSAYIPRVVAVLGVLSSMFVTFCAFAYLLFPEFGRVVSANWYELPTGVFDLVLSFWVLVRGLRPTFRDPELVAE